MEKINLDLAVMSPAAEGGGQDEEEEEWIQMRKTNKEKRSCICLLPMLNRDWLTDR